MVRVNFRFVENQRRSDEIFIKSSFTDPLNSNEYCGCSSVPLNFGDGDGTPYEKMDSFFNSSVAMNFNQLPRSNDMGLSKWHCVGATPNTSVSDLYAQNRDQVFARVYGKIMVSPFRPEVPGTPGMGSLIPGTPSIPAVPEVDRTVNDIRFVPNDGSFNTCAEEVGSETQENHFELLLSPKLIASWDEYLDQVRSRVTIEFKAPAHSTTEYIVKGSANLGDVTQAYYNFNYCWKE